MPPSSLYYCPRCNYSCHYKKDMRKHFERKTMCANNKNLDLTDEIKEYVLIHHVYHPPKKTNNVINQKLINYITYSNNLNTFINKMQLTDKLSNVLDYHGLSLIDLDDQLDQTFEEKVDNLIEDKYKRPYVLNQDELIDIIDNITKINKTELNHLNIIFDKTVNTLKIWQDQQWNSYIDEAGAKIIISSIKSYYLNEYEIYLIKKLHQEDQQNIDRVSVKEHLEIYYRFIAVFGLVPFIVDNFDRDILGHILVDNNNKHLSKMYSELFEQIRQSLKPIEINMTKKRIIKILKNNTIHNINELNQAIIELIKIDDNFNDYLSQKITDGKSN